MKLVLRVLRNAKELFTRTPTPGSLTDVAREWDDIGQEGVALLGATPWALLRSYGRVMSGTYSGQYVSSLPGAEVRTILQALERGDRVAVHLMHRHRKGCYDASALSFAEGRLLMHFPGRTEPAE